jgi:hypothetical protein
MKETLKESIKSDNNNSNNNNNNNNKNNNSNNNNGTPLNNAALLAHLLIDPRLSTLWQGIHTPVPNKSDNPAFLDTTNGPKGTILSYYEKIISASELYKQEYDNNLFLTDDYFGESSTDIFEILYTVFPHLGYFTFIIIIIIINFIIRFIQKCRGIKGITCTISKLA